MMFLSRAESSYLHQHLSVVRHVTLDPEGPGVLRIHLLPCKKARRNVPFVALLNGQDILPLSVSWAILLAGLMDALQPFEGKEITEDQWTGIAAQAVETAAAVYPKTAPDQIRADLNAMLTSFRALTAGQEPPVHVQPMDLGAYARYMAAPPYGPDGKLHGKGRYLALQPEMPALLRRQPAPWRGERAGYRPMAGCYPKMPRGGHSAADLYRRRTHHAQ